MGQLLALLSAIFMGLGNVFARKGMDEGKSNQFSGLFITLVINNLLNAIFFIVYILMYGGVSINLPGMIYNVIGGFLNSFAGRGMLFLSISYIGASRAGVLKVVTPLFGILGGVVLLNEVVLFPAWIGIVVVLAGIVIISVETMEQQGRLVSVGIGSAGVDCSNQQIKVKPNAMTLSIKGIIFGILASLFFGGGNICRKIGVAYIPNPLLGVFIGSLVALVSAGITQLIRGKGNELINGLKNISLSYILSGIFTSLALYSLFWSLGLAPITIVSSISASEALFTIMASVILIGTKEIVNWRVLIGALIVIGGIVILIVVK